MSSLIVAETCPLPEFNLSPRDVEGLVDELKIYHTRFESAFRRPEPFQWSGIYLKGLLGDEPRKSIEPIALQAGVNVRDLENPNEIKFYLSNAPADIDKAELVRISGYNVSEFPGQLPVFKTLLVEENLDHFHPPG